MNVKMRKILGAWLGLLLLTVSGQSEGLSGARLELQSVDGNTRDVRRSRVVALRVMKGDAPSPFIASGAYTATWTGSFKLASRQRLYFKFVGKGDAVLTVNGEVVLESKGDDLSGVESARIRLNPGDIPFVCAYKSPADGDGQLRLLWKGRDFPWEPVPASFLVHDVDEHEASGMTIRHGRDVFAQQQCIQCHAEASGFGKDGMPELATTSPSLIDVGRRLNADWMAHWIQNPVALRPQARMPRLLPDHDVASAMKAGRTDAWDMAAYLTTLSTADVGAGAPDVALAKEGGNLFATLGCASCHVRPASGAPVDGDSRLPLRDVAWKFKPGALVGFLKEPGKDYPWTRMPDFNLTDEEAESLASFLLADAKTSTGTGQPLNGDAARGKELIETYGCVNCHQTSTEQVKHPRPALLSLDSAKAGCVAELPGKAPLFNLTTDDKAAVRDFLVKGYGSLQRRSLAEFSERVVRDLNCVACHGRDGAVSAWETHAPDVEGLRVAHESDSHVAQDRPSLDWVGEKLHADWMAQLFAGVVDGKPRPWLAARMPSFKARAGFLAKGFSLASGVTPSGAPKVKVDPLLVATGKKLVGTKGGFSCTLCHDVGKGKAIATFEVEGLNLGFSRERLRPEYYVRWMLKPNRVEPRTKMPAFAAEDGTTGFVDIFEGDAAKQFDAIWQYLQAGREIEPPEGIK